MSEVQPHAEDAMEGEVGPGRKVMPKNREGFIHKVEITTPNGNRVDGYIIANPFEDGELGEVFLQGFGQGGSTLDGWTQAFAIMLSISLQFGAELPMLSRKFAHMKFEPFGTTDNPDIPRCQSVPDYIFRYLGYRFGDDKLKAELRKIDEEMSGS